MWGPAPPFPLRARFQNGPNLQGKWERISYRRAAFLERFVLGRPPVIRLLLIVQVPHTCDERSMALAFRPIDRF
jgi:hypothetical protein